MAAFKKLLHGGHCNQRGVVVWGVLGWFCLFHVSAWGQFSGGSGTVGDPYLISDANDLEAIGLDSNHWDKHFKLTADLDLTGVAMMPIGNLATPFSGTFDGDDRTIANLTIDLPAISSVGLFGYVFGVDPGIFNLGLINPNITGDNRVGALAGQQSSFKGTLSGCYAEGGTVNGDLFVGGLVGSNAGAISNSYATGAVDGLKFVGGLVGTIGTNGTIIDSYATGSATGNERVGGLVGNVTGLISNSYATGAVDGIKFVGGLVGYNNSGTISNSYSIGLVKNGIPAADVGGLVGLNFGHAISSYWATDSSGQGASAGGIGKTLAQMKQVTTFVSWGCEAVWTIDEGNDTPRLVWENSSGTLITDLPAYGGGSGTSNDPFLISTSQELLDLSLTTCHWDKHFKLISDPNMAGLVFTPIGTTIIPFTVTLDGNGHSIANITINLGLINYVGLFGYVDNAVDPNTIFNLGLVNPNITGDENVGGLVGRLVNGTILSCFVEGGNVSGDFNVGGLVGYNISGAISNCYVTGQVNGNSRVGGLLGFNSSGMIINCTATGQLNSTSNVGGLVGSNCGAISNCYAIGLVNNGISGTFVGGLVGNSTAIVFNSYWATDTSGQATSSGGIGKLLVEMKQAATFIGWGCGFWTIDEGNDTPRLFWEEASGVLITNSPNYSGGTGDPETPFMIATAQDLLDLSLTKRG